MRMNSKVEIFKKKKDIQFKKTFTPANRKYGITKKLQKKKKLKTSMRRIAIQMWCFN